MIELGIVCSTSRRLKFLIPCIIRLLFLNTKRFCFVKMAVQLSSQSFPIDVREEFFRLCTMKPVCAVFDKFGIGR